MASLSFCIYLYVRKGGVQYQCTQIYNSSNMKDTVPVESLKITCFLLVSYVKVVATTSLDRIREPRIPSIYLAFAWGICIPTYLNVLLLRSLVFSRVARHAVWGRNLSQLRRSGSSHLEKWDPLWRTLTILNIEQPSIFGVATRGSHKKRR